MYYHLPLTANPAPRELFGLRIGSAKFPPFPSRSIDRFLNCVLGLALIGVVPRAKRKEQTK